jgi:pyruvate/2-oxoglutarate/acetoin dehydrogenase E1 component
MRQMTFRTALADALSQAMAEDANIVLLGEDAHFYHSDLLVRFGPERVLSTPISESAFLGAAVTAAMAGLRPVVDLLLVDFVAVAMDALLNHAAKVEAFSGGKWQVPLVVRAACGGGYGDGGQHEQSLWGWLGHIPGLTVVAPATPADAGGLFLAALQDGGPVLFLEHKMLSELWLDFMGGSRRSSISFEVPTEWMRGQVPDRWAPEPIGKAVTRREGDDLTIVTVSLGVHQALAAASILDEEGVSAAVIDLRTVSPLDKSLVRRAVAKTGRLLVVDEDYEAFGLSGELAAICLEESLRFSYRRVCTTGTIPYARHLEDQTVPNIERIVAAARELIEMDQDGSVRKRTVPAKPPEADQ